MTQETLTSLFGWMAVINLVYLGVATLMLIGLKDWISGIHGRMFGLDEAELSSAYFQWLGTYKTLTLVFTVAPYIALKLI